MKGKPGATTTACKDFVSAKVNGRDCQLREFARLTGGNGYTTALVEILHAGRYQGPFLMEPPITEGWGYNFDRTDSRDGERQEWCVTPVFAHALQSALIQRDELIQAAKAMLLELNSSGCLLRSDETVSKLDELLEQFQADAPAEEAA